MFGVGYRTPAKGSQASTDSVPLMSEAPRDSAEARSSPSEAPAESNSPTKGVRRSIDEWETGRTSSTSNPQNPQSSPVKEAVNVPPKQKPRLVLSQGAAARGTTMTVAAGSQGLERPRGRVAEAKACLIKAKLQINSSRNLKAEIKAEVIHAVETLYRLVKEAEAAKPLTLTPSPAGLSSTAKPVNSDIREALEGHGLLIKKSMDLTTDMLQELKQQNEHTQLLHSSIAAMKLLNGAMEKHKETMEKASYANVAAGIPKKWNPGQAALHSVVVSSRDDTETGEDVLTQIREAVNAKEGWIKIDRVRKAKDRKVIVGCSTEEERQKVKERLNRANDRLNVEEIQNQNPLLILKDVLNYNSDEDIKKALRNQNKRLFESIDTDDRIEVRFRRKTRNPHASHVIIRVSPKLWLRMVEAETVHIDMQRVRVADHSPLVQCSLCLGYGHGRRFCKESVAKCSHCGGSHMKADCADWLANTPPECCNCTRQKVEKNNHNAFSQECPVRRKWDALARAKVAYC